MEKVSNESLALLMVAVIVVVIGAIVSVTWMGMPGITGRAASEGTASLNISQDVTIELLTNVSFGTGTVNTSDTYCVVHSNDSSKPSCWVNTTVYSPTSFIVRNLGNAPMNVTIQTNETAATFIAGTAPNYTYGVESVTSGGATCTAATLAASGWDNFAAADTEYNLINWTGGCALENVTVAVSIKIPNDAFGYKSSKITFTSNAL